MEKKYKRNDRKLWFRCVKAVLKIFVRKPKFKFLGDEFTDQSIVLCNHIGMSGPLTNELYFPRNFRFWGTYEMNSGLKEVYKYLSTTYFHKKKHFKKGVAKLVSVVAAPVCNVFYKGIRLISTYPDHRFKNTINESLKTLKENKSLIIFPEDSSNGYFDKLTSFFAGFIVLAKTCLKRGLDLPIYVCYFRKKDKKYIVDKPILCSELLAQNLSRYELAKNICDRTNELGQMFTDEK